MCFFNTCQFKHDSTAVQMDIEMKKKITLLGVNVLVHYYVGDYCSNIVLKRQHVFGTGIH